MMLTMRAARLATALAVVALLAGCLSGTKQRVSAEQTLNLKTAAVVNLLDPWPRLHIASIEPTQTHDHALRIRGWEVDKLVVPMMQDRLRRKGFTVVEANAPVLPKAYDNDWSRPDVDTITRALTAAGKSSGIDLFVVVYRQVADDFMEDSIEKVRGYGLFQRRGDPHAYASVEVQAINVRLGAVIGHSAAQDAVSLPTGLWPPVPDERRGNHVPPVDLHEGLVALLEPLVRNAVLVAAQEAGVSN